MRCAGKQLVAFVGVTGCVLVSVGLGSGAAQGQNGRSVASAAPTHFGFPLLSSVPSGTSHSYLRVLVAVTRARKPVYSLMGPGSIAIPLTSSHGDREVRFSGSRHGWTHLAAVCVGGRSLTLLRHEKVVFRFSTCNGGVVWQNTIAARALHPGVWAVKASQGAAWTLAAITDNRRTTN